MWEMEPLEGYKRRCKHWPKKYRRELIAVHDNLDTFFKALRSGQTPAQAKFGFIHPESLGALAIDPKGGGPHLKETRLYIYPDEKRQRLYVITLGDKDTQTEDIKACKPIVQALWKEDVPEASREERAHVQQ